MLLTILKVAVVSYVALNVLAALGRSELRQEAYQIARGLRARHFLVAAPFLALTITTAILLVQLPLLSFGWWSLLGGEGSIAAGDTGSGRGADVVSVLVISIVLLALPIFAHLEEQVFRKGAEGRTLRQNSVRAVKFGLVHLVMGIPIGVALALAIGGGVFTWAYLRGHDEWTRTHPSLEEKEVALADEESGRLLAEARAEQAQRAGIEEATKVHLAWNLTVFVPAYLFTILALL